VLPEANIGILTLKGLEMFNGKSGVVDDFAGGYDFIYALANRRCGSNVSVRACPSHVRYPPIATELPQTL